MVIRISIPLAALALLMAFVLIGQPSQVKANATFAQVQESLEKIKTISFRQRTIPIDPDTEEEIEQVHLLAPSIMRFERANGNYSLIDLKRGRSMGVSQDAKRVILIEGMANATPAMRQENFYEYFRNVQDNAAKELAAKEIDGKQCPGFILEREVSHPMLKNKLIVKMKAWIDSHTQLPVLIEEWHPGPKNRDEYRKATVMDQFVFDEPLDPKLFSFDPPDGFEVQSYGVEKLAPPKQNVDLQKPVLTPRVGLGPVKFGMKKSDVEKQFGKPEKVTPLGDSGASLDYYSRGVGFTVSNVLGVTGISANSNTFSAVQVREFAGKTDKGIRIGSLEADVRKAYGEPSRVEDRSDESGPKTLYYDDLNGWFSLWQGKVESMYFAIPRELKLKIFEQGKTPESPK